ncbi:unnamed protein product [Hermetia illucens]|uniref:Cx9C motif-containing protein 4 n=1 Tax=Hermetia illucens TaxID=343691 RepID=A0A7R8UXM4_HERIL|nr:cx9C motif-containing protein 4 isoform X2 [Hermetia illucens]CAD7088984.1 unnamed protein product [Hermetia illucens]
MSKNRKDPCKANACRIQSCLKENNYQEGSCLDVLEDMRQCCLKWHDQSLCCSGINLEKSYLPKKSVETGKETNQKGKT